MDGDPADIGAVDAETEVLDLPEGEQEQHTPAAPSLADFDIEALRADPRVQKLIDDQAAAARAATERKVKRSLGKQKQPAQTPTNGTNGSEPPPWASAIVERLDRIEGSYTESQLKQAFTARGLSDDSFEIVQKLHGVDKPSDLNAWLDKTTQKLGLGATPAARAEDSPPPRPAATPTPGSTPTAANRDYLSGAPIDPKTLSQEDVQHLRQSGQFLPVLERWRMRNVPASGRKRPDK
jgi:hypothetical protein